MSESELLKISEVAELAQVLASTIRHYTDVGLLRVAGYTDGGHRLYAKGEVISRIEKIQTLSKRGFSLPQIKTEIEGSKGKKLLLVDDDPEVGEFVTELMKLRYPDWTIRVATDGFSAGTVLSEYYPDIVILDLMLPGVNGFAVCQQIRKDPAHKGVRIIGITGYDSPEMKSKIFAAGADDYLAKPMDVNDLIEKIKKLLQV